MKSILNFKRALAALCTMSMLGLSGSALATDWDVPGDFPTIQLAIDSPAVEDGDTIRVAPGDHDGANVTKAVTIKGQGGARIISGPILGPHVQGFRLTEDASDSTISHLTFTTDVTLAIYSGGQTHAGFADNVTITQCTFLNNIQAITNWGGRAWDISHNTITDLRTSNGGGIGIFIGDRDRRDEGVNGNVVSHNTISGYLNVHPDDQGGYSGAGIAIYADFRFANLGTESLDNNRVVKNKVSMVSSNPTVVDIDAFEMAVTVVLDHLLMFDNAIGFNDFRGTANEIALHPEELNGNNDISRNFGENRGHGDHPSAF